MCLWESLHVDAGQHDVVQDVDPVDLVQLSDAVLELKQRDVVHRDPERLVSAQDLHLEHRGQTCYMLHVICAHSERKQHIYVFL